MIQARDLTRTFKVKKETVEAVQGLSLDVAEGELVAFLGPNGAGKSTSLKMLTTLLPPTSGTALVAGHDIRTNPAAVRRSIGYVGQGSGVGQYHKVRDELLTQAKIQRMDPAEGRHRADELLEMLELTGLEKRVGSTLSGGQKRRLDVALGLMHRPKLLFLDEPTTGLDPHARANLWEHILKLRRETGMTIFLTTHYLDEADTMSERILVIDHGRLIADDTPERLKAELAGDRIAFSLGNEGQAEAAARLAGGLDGVREVSRTGRELILTLPQGAALLPQLVLKLTEAGAEVTSAALRRPTLDDVFLALTGRSLRDSAAAA